MDSDRRNGKRLDLDVKLVMKGLNGNTGKIQVEIIDLSKSGIGFKCDEKLTMGDIYQAELTIWTKEVIITFINIVRQVEGIGANIYGGTFTGMTQSDMCKIEIYEMFDEAEANKKS